jgi:hypothetical protein
MEEVVMSEGVLDYLAVKHGTDKSTANHKYTPIYERYMSKYMSYPLHFLEIGIKDGNSLRLWDDYFEHPKAKLSALDINAECVKNTPATSRWQGIVGKQSSPSALQQIVDRGPLDVVLDDGSHRGADQKASLEFLWPHMTKNGIYIIEDLHTAYQKSPHWNKNVNIVDFVRAEFIDKFLRHPEEKPTIASFVHMYKRIIVIGK